MRFILNLLAVVAVGFSVTTACSKKQVDNASLYGKWKLVSSTSPYIARIATPGAGSVLSLGTDGEYEITSQGVVKDSGTFVLSLDSVAARPNVLYFNYLEYYQNGLDGRSAFTVNIQGDVLELTFLTSLEFAVTPVARFKKL
jgi:hypothetical protein